LGNGVLVNDTDVDIEPLTVSEVSGLAANVNGTVPGSNLGNFIIFFNGNFTFDPISQFEYLDDNESNVTSVTYKVFDGTAISTSSATLSVNVTGVNDAPVALADSYTIDENSSFTDIEEGNLGLGVLKNDTDIDIEPLFVAEVDDVDTNVNATIPGDDLGRFTVYLNGTFTFDSNNEFEYLDTGEWNVTKVSYNATDLDEFSNQVFVSVNVTGVNDAPIAFDDYYLDVDFGGDEDNSFTINDGGALGLGVLKNDTDIDIEPLSVKLVNGTEAKVGIPVAGSNGGN